MVRYKPLWHYPDGGRWAQCPFCGHINEPTSGQVCRHFRGVEGEAAVFHGRLPKDEEDKLLGRNRHEYE